MTGLHFELNQLYFFFFSFFFLYASSSFKNEETGREIPLYTVLVLIDEDQSAFGTMAAHSQLDVIKQTSLALPEGSYIYDLCRHGSDKLAAISSDNSLRCFDRRTLELAPHGVVRDTHSAGVTGLAEFAGSSNLLVTGGNDGAVRMWDLREGKDGAVVEFNAGMPVTMMVVVVVVIFTT